MLTSQRSTSGNRHIDLLQHLFESSTLSVNWLVITHDEPRVIHSLSSALSGESAVILPIPQNTWDFGDEKFSEVIEWALQQDELENIVLVGHSRAAGPPTASLVTPASDDARDAARDENVSRVLAGAKRSSLQAQQARKAFADKMQQLSELSAVQDRWSSDEIAIHGLFYQAESGVFLAYDIQQGSFRPLLA